MFTVIIGDGKGPWFKAELERVPVAGDYVIEKDDTVWLIDRVWQTVGGGIGALGRKLAAGEGAPPDWSKTRED